MKNFKLTDDAKRILIKALTLCDDEIVVQSKDDIICKINNMTDSNDLAMYYAYILPALKAYCNLLKRELDNEKFLDEDLINTRSEYRLTCKLRDAVLNFTNQS